MILNGIMAIILHYFTKFRSFGANYIQVDEIRASLSVTEI